MNAIHQISLKLRLGIDTHANIQPEVLLEKWQDFMARQLDTSTHPPCSVKPAGKFPSSNGDAVTHK